jgi:hypothetical protein
VPLPRLLFAPIVKAKLVSHGGVEQVFRPALKLINPPA